MPPSFHEQQILDLVDGQWAATVWPVLAAFEAVELAAHEQYTQCYRSHLAIPADGVSALPDTFASAKPWPAALAAETVGPMYFAAYVFEYVSEDGPGFQAFLTVQLTSEPGALRVWTRSENHGPASEDGRTFAWQPPFEG